MTHQREESPPAVTLRDVGINFTARQRGEWVLRHLDLDVPRDEFFVLVGPSGCGKSTLLRMIAGITEATEGTVHTTRGRVQGPGVERGMVFQSVDTPLMEWLTARANVEFGLRMQRVPRRRRREIAERYLLKVGLTKAADKYPHELSGGMKQRVQIARILAVRPEIILMDEPFAALDAQTRRLLQREVADLWRDEPRTILYVTHDIREAVLLGQRVAVMSAPPQSVIKSIHRIDLPYPRDEFSPEFVALTRRIEADIEEEVTKLWAEAEAPPSSR